MSGQSHRLAAGGLIDRQQTLKFEFDGKQFDGHPGDTLASALLANGVSLLGRSFKYHRARGLLSAGPEEPNALVELRRGARQEANTKATSIELFDGLSARSQNRFPALGFDLLAINQLVAPLFAAGFYYKTFMWPSVFWEKLYEPIIRHAAGLGRISTAPDPDTYEKANAFCDLLVIGGGPAGLSAALVAGRAGARVILCDEDFLFGGRMLSERQTIGEAISADWVAATIAELSGMPNVTLMPRTGVFGTYDTNTFGALERVSDHLAEPAPHQPRQRLWKIVARTTILATGALERPIVFGNNDLPGVMLASAVRTYLNRYAVAPGQRAAIFTATDDGWRTAAVLKAAGAEIAAVVDVRSQVDPSVRALAGDVPFFEGAEVTDAHGSHHIRRIDIGSADGRKHSIEIDLLAVSGGFNPQIGLGTHLGGKGDWSPDHAAFLLGQSPRGMLAVGAAAGDWTTQAALTGGTAAAERAIAELGFQAVKAPVPTVGAEHAELTPCFHVPNCRKKAFVDLQNDVTTKDIELAVREGFSSVEHLKRYTTLGMGTDQGKTSNVVGLAILAELTGKSIPETGATRMRPPQFPVAIGALAGLHRGKDFKPTRLTAGHEWAKEQDASFTESGQWLRAQWFARPGETDWLQSVSREVETVRNSVGICDVSTLGKIALNGPDVGTFLDRVYCNMFSTLKVGKARYGLMLREDGFVMDDGTTARLREDAYVMSTTTANAGKVMQHLEYCHQVLWPEMDLAMVSITEQWAQYAVAGPRSRDLLGNLFGVDFDLSDEAVPYMAALEVTLGTVPARLFRVSFSGERAYEIAVPARYGDALARALLKAGEEFDAIPYGTEALGVMRVEKGHVSGPELNGQTIASDFGLGRMMSKKKHFIGEVLAGRPALVDPHRPSLAGFMAVDPKVRLRAGAQFCLEGAPAEPENDQGHMTSTAFSPSLNRWIALGLIAGGQDRIGETITAHDPLRGTSTKVRIVSPVFIDPDGERLRA